MNDVPAKYKTIGVLQLVAGLCNMFFGWWFASMFLGMGAGLVTTICSFGLCPIGFMCGLVSFLIIPLGMVETIVGILTLVNPEAVRPVHAWLPLAQFPAILLGDFISPVVGLICFVMARDPEVAGYIQGM